LLEAFVGVAANLNYFNEGDRPMLDENKDLARRLYDECWNRGKLDLVDEVFSKDCKYHDAVFPTLGPGGDSMRRHIQMCRTAFPDLTFKVDDIIAEKDEVVVHWTARGTQQGQFLGVAPTNRNAEVSGTTICKIRNNRIVEQWADWNLLTLLERLGVTTAQKLTVGAR
jgi:steroid delta-isomerase-like uncharacterized protein